MGDSGGGWMMDETCKRCGLCPDDSGDLDPSTFGREWYRTVPGKRPDVYVDPCLGVLPGVQNACCGHGVKEQAYIHFTNGVVIRGFTVIETDELTLGVRRSLKPVEGHPEVQFIEVVHDESYIEIHPHRKEEEHGEDDRRSP